MAKGTKKMATEMVRVFVITSFEIRKTPVKQVRTVTKALCEESGTRFEALVPQGVAGWAKKTFATFPEKQARSKSKATA